MTEAETAKVAAKRLAGPTLAKGFKPEKLHVYRYPNGEPIYWRIRCKHPTTGEKWIRPMRLNGHGYELAEPDFPSGKKPLYRLDAIAAAPDATVYVTEGEKPADALAKVGAVSTTSGSSSSASGADWEPLRGRTVVIFPDNDDPGKVYAGEVAAILLGMGCKVSVIDVAALNLPSKGDAVEWLAGSENASLSNLETLPLIDAHPMAQNAPEADLRGPRWPDALDPAAMHGIAGEFVRMLEPNTEADPAAILVQFLAAFGAYVGRGPHYKVEGDTHHANINPLLVGATAKGRKGTSWGRTREVFERIPDWKPQVSGLSSGEGLKFHVRDPKEETKKNQNGEMVTQITDPGVADKRLFVVESEFAAVLRAAQRQGSTLSATIREAWDSGNLRTLTKNDPVTATGAHVSIVGHITADELRAELTATDSANGFANRFLFVAVTRSKLLPFGGDADDPAEARAFSDRLRELADLARTRSRIGMTETARHVWSKVYPQLSAGNDGLHGAVTARAEAQTIRLALLSALLDGMEKIDHPHLLAALAVWQYCDQTAKHVFGASLGDRIADEILRRLEGAGDAGLTRTDIRDVFGRNTAADKIGAALDLLQRRGRVVHEDVRGPAGGRPAEVWRVVR